MSQIRELEEQVETLKTETRNRLLQNIDKKYGELGNLRSLHEREIETMTRQIDLLQEQLEETMKSRYVIVNLKSKLPERTPAFVKSLQLSLPLMAIPVMEFQIQGVG